jgi:four helix bundle protein
MTIGRTKGERQVLSHERLDAYRCALDLHVVVRRLVADIGRGQTDIVDQLTRASRSLVLNIAEGAGRTGQRDRQRHWAIARGSALECAAALDVLAAEQTLTAAAIAPAKALLERVVAMLTKMIVA